jgi:hypothetical protein
MPSHAFVDESKVRSLVMVAAVVDINDLRLCREAMTGLLLPNQRRLHFSKERRSRQRRISAVINELPFEAWVMVSAVGVSERVARPLLVNDLAHELLAHSVTRLVLEQDDSVARRDREVLYRVVHEHRAADRFTYLHCRSHEEPLLWLPDAIAWCWTSGGSARRTIASRVTRVIEA